MRACCQIVILAIVALFTTSLRAPSLPSLDLGQESEEQVTAYRATTPPLLSPARHGRSFEGARKAPFLAILPSCPVLFLPLSFCCALSPLADQLRSLPALPRTSRGPPSLS